MATLQALRKLEKEHAEGSNNEGWWNKISKSEHMNKLKGAAQWSREQLIKVFLYPVGFHMYLQYCCSCINSEAKAHGSLRQPL